MPDPSSRAEPTLHERAAAIVEQLLAAPADPQCWEGALADLCSAVSDDAVAVVIGPMTGASPAFVIGHGIGMKQVAAEDLLPSAEHPGEREAGVDQVFEIPRASPMFAATRLYRNVLRDEGIAPGPALCMVIGRNEARITGSMLLLTRNSEWSPRPEDRQLLELLAPHVRRAVELGMRLNERRSGVGALLRILDALVLGVVLLDERGEVAFVNHAGAEILGTGAGLSPPGAPGSAERRQRTEALRRLTRREGHDTESVLTYAHPADGRPLHVVTTELRAGDPADLSGARFASAIFFADPSAGPAGGERALGALYGLTPAEERLALRLAAGETLAEAATRLGVQLSTARGTLRSVFEKTGTHRQASLVRLILTLVGRVRSEDPRG